VYIATADLLKLAERDSKIRGTIALYLAEKAKNGTPRQRKIAEKILRRHFFTRHSSKARPAHKTTHLEIYIMIPQKKNGGPAGIFRRVSPEPGITRAPSGHPSARLPARFTC
jgi:hypothetical protein